MSNKVCIIIPCYKVRDKIISVIKKIDFKIVSKIIVVDDYCPEKSGLFLKKKFKKNNKIEYIFLKKNLGVGGATISGFKLALKKKYDIIIKIDGDDQHNTSFLIKNFKYDLSNKNYDFCKGYRDLSFKNFGKNKMPLIRFFGAISLTLLVRFNSSNWKIKDACHGLIGFNSKFLKKINLNNIKKNYFFEQDIIFATIKNNGKIKQYKNEIKYSNENSSLNPLMSILPFLYYHLIKFMIRLKI